MLIAEEYGIYIIYHSLILLGILQAGYSNSSFRRWKNIVTKLYFRCEK
jgi:hypothetical protein